jgi:hypothetical protein
LSHANANGKGRALMNWVIRFLDDYDREKSEIFGRDLQKPVGEFKTINSLLMTKY